MGTPRIYYYPDPLGSLETIDFGESLSDIHELEEAEVEDAEGGDGTPFRDLISTSLPIRIVLERFGTVGAYALERKLKTLVSHLHRGGLIGFTRDHDRAWCGWTTNPPNRGDTLIYTNGNGFTAWSPAAALASGDEVVIETAHPDCQREILLAPAQAGSIQVELSAPGCVNTYGDDAVVRWRDFYPCLWMPKSEVKKQICTNDHRRNFTLNMVLKYSVTNVIALTEGVVVQAGTKQADTAGPALRDGTAASGFGGYSLEQIVGGTTYHSYGHKSGRS